MNCQQIRLNLLAYLDGEVSESERSQIEAHLEACPDCARELERLQALQSGLWDAVPVGLEQLRLSRTAEQRIRARLRRGRERRGPLPTLVGLLRPRPGLIKAAIPLFVALFLVATAFFGLQPLPVSAQETIVVAPAILAPDTDAALRVIVREAGSTQPIPDAEVTVRLRPQGERDELLYTGRTGQGGTADVRFHVPDYRQDDVPADLIVTTDAPQGHAQVTQPVAVRRGFRLYLTSDKPLYQPGQMIYMRVLALDAISGLPAISRRVILTVQGTNGEQLYQKTVRTSDYGIAAADFSLPAAAPHGTYRLIAALGDTISDRTVTVGRYERPRFRVDLAPARTFYLSGEVVEGQVTARFFDKSPLSGVAVTLRAYHHDPGRQLIATLQGRTNAGGTYAFSFGLPSDLSSTEVNLALEAAVTDEAGHVEWAGHVVPIAADPLVIDVVAESGRLRPGVENTVYILVTTPDGAPARAQLDVGVANERVKLTTDEYGLAQFRFTPPSGVREAQVQVAASDEQGRTVTRTVSLSADHGPAQMLLRLDRAAYEVGEAMHLEVLATQGDVAYLDVVRREGGQTLSTHLVKLRDGRADLALDVSPEMAGTLALHAYQVLPDGTLTRDTRLAVVDAPTQVTVNVRTDKTAYRPGDTAHISMDTSIEGQPVRSAVGIAVVDESVFALEDRAPGFAKLFFLLEASLRDPDALPTGVALADLLDPADAAGVRAAQDIAARAAWANLPTGELEPNSSVSAPSPSARPQVRWLGLGLSIALIGLPLVLWVAIVWRLRRAGSLRLAARPLIVVLISFSLLAPALVAALGGMSLIAGQALSILLLGILGVPWIAVLVALGIAAWSRQDNGAQIILLLTAAYVVLGALLGYVVSQGIEPGLWLGLGIAVTFVATLVALLLLGAGFWAEGRRGTASLIWALALLLVGIVALVAAMLSASSFLARTLADPQLYAGPIGWFSGCAAKPAAPAKEVSETIEVEKEVEKVVKETVVVEKEKVIEKEVTKVVEQEVEKIATASPFPTTSPTWTPIPLPTASPLPPAATPVATATPPLAAPTATSLPTLAPTASPTSAPTEPSTAMPTREPELPPPLLGQFVPETIYWAPEAITDERGHLELDIPLPDAPASWRLTALASTRRGELGAATEIITVRP
jgi:anti-sigma factor RsiW